MLSALIVFVGIGTEIGIQPAVFLRYCSSTELLRLLRKLRKVMADRSDCLYSAARFLQLAANDRAGNLGVGLDTINLALPLSEQLADRVIYIVDTATWHVRVYSPYAGLDCPDCKHAGAAPCQGCLGCPSCRSLVADPACEVCRARDSKVRAAMLDPNVRIGFVRDLQDYCTGCGAPGRPVAGVCKSCAAAGVESEVH